MKVLECAQRRESKLEKGLKVMYCEEGLRTLCLSSFERRSLRGNLTAPYSFLGR